MKRNPILSCVNLDVDRLIGKRQETTHMDLSPNITSEKRSPPRQKIPKNSVSSRVLHVRGSVVAGQSRVFLASPGTTDRRNADQRVTAIADDLTGGRYGKQL